MRQRALELFNEKVEEQKSLHEKKSKEEGHTNTIKLFLDMVPKLTNIVKDKETVRISFSIFLFLFLFLNSYPIFIYYEIILFYFFSNY